MRISSVVRALVAAKATPEMILAAVEAAEADDESAIERRRASDRRKTAVRRSRMDVSQSEWFALRSTVFARDGRICSYCCDTCGPHEIDHKIPITRGGDSSLSNLVVACRSCNAAKKDQTVEEWRSAQ